MANAQSFPTLWPSGFDPDDQSRSASAVVVDRANMLLGEEVFHQHHTGQLALAVRGLVGMAFPDGVITVPVHCAVWVPPEELHNGQLGHHSESIYLMVTAEACRRYALPTRRVSMVINPMTFEMVRFLAQTPGGPAEIDEYDCIVSVILSQIAKASEISPIATPLPKHPVLQQLARSFSEQKERKTIVEWASQFAMSERTLSRLVRQETGMSFSRWRTQIVMMACLSDLNSGEPLDKLAYKAGFETTSAFIHAFKSVFQTTPGEFRKRP